MSTHALAIPTIGAPAPELELPSLYGAVLRLTDLRGRPVLASFLSHAA